MDMLVKPSGTVSIPDRLNVAQKKMGMLKMIALTIVAISINSL